MLPQFPIDLRCKFQQNKLKFEAYLIYAVIPEARILSDQWKGLAEAIIKTITGLALFYTVAKGGRWLNYDEAAFDNVESKSITDKLIRKLLKYAQYEMASIPRFIFEVLPQEKKRIVPNIVLDSYKQIQHTFALNDDERVSLLNYLLADTNSPTLVLIYKVQYCCLSQISKRGLNFKHSMSLQRKVSILNQRSIHKNCYPG